MKNIINGFYYYDNNNKKPSIYKHMFINDNSSLLKQNNDKRRLLHFSLMEFIKNNYKYNKDLLIDKHKKNLCINENSKFQSYMKKKMMKKINNNFFTKINFFQKKLEFEISTNEKNNHMLSYKYKQKNSNSSFNICPNKNKKIENKNSGINNIMNSSAERDRVNNNKIYGKNKVEENDIIIDYELGMGMNKDELKNNNIVYIRKKNSNINIFNNNIPLLKKEPIIKENLNKSKDKKENKNEK